MRALQRVIEFYEPDLGRMVTAGKFAWVRVNDDGGYWAYVNNVTVREDLMEELDAWGIAPCVLQAMERRDIDQIHYCSVIERLTYIADVGDVKRFGILKKYGTRGTHWHLPRRYWRKASGLLEYPWINRRLELEWLEPEVARG